MDTQDTFRRFAAQDCSEDPLYVAICLAVADSPALLALLELAPPTQRKPNLLLAALHERILAGATHALRDYYPSVGGARPPDAELPALLADFARVEAAGLAAHLRSRSTQTNEVGRCAVLWPALAHIAALSGGRELALLDFGSSAGLNLGVDLYRYDYGHFSLGAPDSALTVNCRWLGDAPPPAGGFRIRHRLGLDPAPVDLRDPDQRRWLRACLWPHDLQRAARFEQAAALAGGHEVRRAEDCTAAIEPWLASLPPGVQPVLFNSWVLHYFSPDQGAAHRAAVERLVRDRGLVWLSAESPAAAPPQIEVSALPPPHEASATLWTLQTAAGARALAWSHAHGRWLQWGEGAAA